MSTPDSSTHAQRPDQASPALRALHGELNRSRMAHDTRPGSCVNTVPGGGSHTRENIGPLLSAAVLLLALVGASACDRWDPEEAVLAEEARDGPSPWTLWEIETVRRRGATETDGTYRILSAEPSFRACLAARELARARILSAAYARQGDGEPGEFIVGDYSARNEKGAKRVSRTYYGGGPVFAVGRSVECWPESLAPPILFQPVDDEARPDFDAIVARALGAVDHRRSPKVGGR